MTGSPKPRPLVVVRVGRGLSPGPPGQNSSAPPTEIIEMDQNGLGGGGDRAMHEDAASRNRVARDERYTY